MSKTRATWHIKPHTQVKKDKTKYNRKRKHKKRDDY